MVGLFIFQDKATPYRERKKINYIYRILGNKKNLKKKAFEEVLYFSMIKICNWIKDTGELPTCDTQYLNQSRFCFC